MNLIAFKQDQTQYININFLFSFFSVLYKNFLNYILLFDIYFDISTVQGEQKKRMPYGELGSVDITQSCGCYSFDAGGLAGSSAEGAASAISPGCGCSSALVTEIVGKKSLLF